MSWWRVFGEEGLAVAPLPSQESLLEFVQYLVPDVPPTFPHFDDFHTLLLKTFLVILCTTLVLIFVSWKLYGKKISERFMKPATSKAIQELKESVSRLKLPKEHTPRI